MQFYDVEVQFFTHFYVLIRKKPFIIGRIEINLEKISIKSMRLEKMQGNDEISREIALKLCEEVRAENKHKLFSIGKIQCYFCWKFGRKKNEKGEIVIHNICAFNNGCHQVNKLYKERYLPKKA